MKRMRSSVLCLFLGTSDGLLFLLFKGRHEQNKLKLKDSHSEFWRQRGREGKLSDLITLLYKLRCALESILFMNMSVWYEARRRQLPCTWTYRWL